MVNVVLVKTQLNFEKIAASYIKEILKDKAVKITPIPRGFKGLVIVETNDDPTSIASIIEEKIPEAEKVLPIEAVCKAELQEIAETVAKIAKKVLKKDTSFAVRTVRRGRHNFTSIDVNVVSGNSIREETGASVDLESPDYIFRVEIIQDTAYIALVPGFKELRKMRPGKYPVYKLFRKLSIVQMPYLGPTEAAFKMGERIGRGAQTFEVGELIIAPAGRVRAHELNSFLQGIFEGIESRYRVQVKSYGREVHRVNVFLQDIHQLVRERANETIIVFEPEGEPVSRAQDNVYNMLRRGKRVNLFFGSREGIPTGIYRFADIVLDITPGITISTEYAMVSALVALSTILHNKLYEENG